MNHHTETPDSLLPTPACELLQRGSQRAFKALQEWLPGAVKYLTFIDDSVQSSINTFAINIQLFHQYL